MKPLIISVLSLLLFTSQVAGQNNLITRPISSNTIVRIHLRSGVVEQGRLTHPFSSASDSLMYCRYPAPPCDQDPLRGWTIRLASDVTALDLRRGGRGRAGATRGALIGAAFGSGLSFLFLRAGADVPSGTTVGVVLGSVTIGALVGYLAGEGDSIWIPARERHLLFN